MRPARVVAERPMKFASVYLSMRATLSLSTSDLRAQFVSEFICRRHIQLPYFLLHI